MNDETLPLPEDDTAPVETPDELEADSEDTSAALEAAEADYVPTNLMIPEDAQADNTEAGTTQDGDDANEVPENFDQSDLYAYAAYQYQETGTLDDPTMIALDNAGFSPAMVHQYISGVHATNAVAHQPAIDAAGGSQESLDATLQWAAQNLTPEEIQLNNSLLNNESTKLAALADLYNRWDQDRDVEPSLIGGDNYSSSSVTGFANSKEMAAAIASPKYKTSAEFRAEVARKIAASSKAGINLYV